MSKNYFNRPTQVKFIECREEGTIDYGIAYKDEIICACCGSIISIDEVDEITPLHWIPFDEEIGE